MEQAKIKALQKKATQIRIDIINAVHAAKSGHPGGSLSIADLLTYLYEEEMHYDPKNSKDDNRDRLVLSKGHAAPALYSALAEYGFFPKEDLLTLRKIDSYLQGHPDMKHTPGVDMSTGSLGLGISAACGMALAAKIKGLPYRVYTIVGDGESEEGQVWEALMFAAHYHLDNLCVILDENGLQIDGTTQEVMNTAPHKEKYEAFGYNTLEIDAHDFNQIESALVNARACKGKPTAIVAKSVKGKGVSYMENAVNWHGAAPNDELWAQAISELNATLASLS